MKKRVVFLSVLLLLPTLVSASLIDMFSRSLSIPGGYSIKDLIYLYVIPFIGTFVIVFGLLSKTGIFDNKKINIILAFLFGLALLYTGTMLKLAQFLYKFGAFTSTIAFFTLFLIGIWMYGKKKIYAPKGEGGWKAQYADMEESAKELKKNQKTLQESQKELDYIKKRLRDVQSKIGRMTRSPDAKKKLISIKSNLEQKKVDLETKITGLKGRVTSIAQTVKEKAEEVVEG